MRRFAAFLLCAALAAGCSKEDEVQVSKTPPCEPVLAAMEAICRLDALSTQVGHGHEIGDGFSHMRLNVAGMSAKEFMRELKEFPGKFPGKEVHVWMPGEKHWLLTGSSNGNKISLAKVMDEFAADTNCTMSVAEVFASYAGTREDILPAFERKLKGEVVPEWFVTEKIPEIDWLDTSDVDEDILKATLSEIRSAQVMRRELLRGNMLAAKAKDKKGEEAATEVWAKVAIRSPNDPMLLERIERLNNNAKGFLEVGKVLQAMKCYETVVLIRPNDPVAIHNFGACLMKIGKRDLAEKVLAKAKKLSEELEHQAPSAKHQAPSTKH